MSDIVFKKEKVPPTKMFNIIVFNYRETKERGARFTSI